MKQKFMTYNEEKNQSMKTDPEKKQMLDQQIKVIESNPYGQKVKQRLVRYKTDPNQTFRYEN